MVMSHDYPNASNATVHPIGEDDLARELLRDGQRLRFAHGRHWRDAGHGFFEPVHWLARFLTADAQPPGRCLGFRYALDGTSSDQADGSLPVHLLTDVAGYREERLPHDARRYLRRLPSTGVRLVWVTDARLMRDQGYEVMMDWRRRVGRMRFAPDRERFIRSMERRLDDGSWLVLAGMRDGRLLGYMTAQVVDDTAYLYESKVATEGLRYRLSSALDHAAILAFQRSGSVSQVSAGLHQPELPGLTAYKLRPGFPGGPRRDPRPRRQARGAVPAVSPPDEVLPHDGSDARRAGSSRSGAAWIRGLDWARTLRSACCLAARQPDRARALGDDHRPPRLPAARPLGRRAPR